ncbi:MAG TPA: hypothetical protein VN303_14655 [Pseudomonas sp.]|nr:hypothetical protein [Pseudomonas sp.]
MLILLDTPKSIQHILDKSVFPDSEVLEEINTLIREGFISVSGEAAAPHSDASRPVQAAAASGDRIHLEDEIILSEAKFLLTDFAVDSFGTHSQAFVNEIRACKGVKDLRLCLSTIFAAAEKQCPQQLPALLGLVREINETA